MAVTVKDINWRECEKMHSYTFLTDLQHQIRIVKHSIPVVFIPGIMGTRLLNADGKAWDPDSKGFMFSQYVLGTAEHHKALLIDQPHSVFHHGPPGGGRAASEKAEDTNSSDKAWCKERWAKRLKPILNNPKRNNWQWLPLRADLSADAFTEQAAQVLVDHGWGEVALSFYEDFLFTLGGAYFRSLEQCFVFPVYARGYNWVDSNQDSGAYLANEIKKIIDAEKAIPGRECDRVVIVSHSMGGLASRSAMGLHDLKGSCFGAIHGAQPATGAPEAYYEMRAGAHGGMSALAIGTDSATVMPVLANCAGGLELLPTRLYKTGAGQAGWLQQTDKNGRVMGKVLPAHGDPYAEIYKADKGFLRLILHPELLNPGGQERQDPSIKQGTAQTPQAKSFALMDKADKFHHDLNTWTHDKTAVAYGQDGPATYDSINYAYQRPYQERQDYDRGAGFGKIPDSNPDEGKGADLDKNVWYLIADKHGQGDGTVPRSSGGSLQPTLRKAYQTHGPVHAEFYKDSGVHQFAIDTIGLLAEAYRKQQVGK